MGNSFSSTEKGASHRKWRLFGVEKKDLTFTFSLSASTLAEERLRLSVQDLRTGEPEWISMSWGGCTSKLSPPCWPARNVADQAPIKHGSCSTRTECCVLAASRNGSQKSTRCWERRKATRPGGMRRNQVTSICRSCALASGICIATLPECGNIRPC